MDEPTERIAAEVWNQRASSLELEEREALEAGAKKLDSTAQIWEETVRHATEAKHSFENIGEIQGWANRERSQAAILRKLAERK